MCENIVTINFYTNSMRKILTLILSLAFVLGSFSFVVQPALAQTEDGAVTYGDWDTDWDDWENDIETTYETDFEGSEEIATILGGAGAIFGGIIAIFAIILSLGMYIYTSIALMKIAKRLNYENAWFAWIPILNMVLVLKMGDMNPLLVLLILIPGLGGLALAIISIIALMKVCEKLGYDKLLALLVLIPIGNLILLGMLAWGKKKETGQVMAA
jgi:hypothetical protein